MNQESQPNSIQETSIEDEIEKLWKGSESKGFEFGLDMVKMLSTSHSEKCYIDDSSLRNFLIDLQTKPEWYKKRILSDFFPEKPEIGEACLNEYFRPALTAFLKEIIEGTQENLSLNHGEQANMDQAISHYVQGGKFNEAIDEFCQKEGLSKIDLDLCSKIFYKIFKQHFDSRAGLGVVEMINVGKHHPEELKRMMLMEEYDDIRAALLRLQLTGKISSLNYQ